MTAQLIGYAAATAVVCLIVWLGFRYAKKSGASEVSAGVNKQAAEKKDAMLKAEVDGPRDRDGLVGRLRKHDF